MRLTSTPRWLVLELFLTPPRLTYLARPAEDGGHADGAAWAPRPRVDNALVKALARAFRLRRALDTCVHATLEDLARAKGVAPSYVSRVLRLTLLAPEIVEAILDGRQPAEMQLDDLLMRLPLDRRIQASSFEANG
jgi:hypothetical protein